MYKKVSQPSVAAFQSSWILLAIALVVDQNLLFCGLACRHVLGWLHSYSFVGVLGACPLTPHYNTREYIGVLRLP